MKKILFFFLLSIPLFSFTQPTEREFQYTEGDTTYTMKKYIICFLKKGPNRDQDKAAADSIQKLHLAHMDRLGKEGKIAIAGPFGDEGDIRGIVVYDVESIEEAKELTSGDPAVKAGRLVMEFHPWWAAKGSKLP